MKLEMSALIKDEDERQLLVNIKQNLELATECCIYRVHKPLRQINEEAYTPQMISIGPLHHGKEELADMENQKIRYIESFLERITIEKWEEMLTFIKNNEQRIRNCYAENSKLESLEFVVMILYDAIFIIELFWRDYNYNQYRNDFLLNKPVIEKRLHLDLLLLENQLPYFVLEELYRIAFVGPNLHNFQDLSYNYLKDDMLDIILEQAIVLHFIDLIRTAVLKSYPKVELKREYIVDLPCAVKLHESGVKFTGIEGGCLLDIKFKKRKQKIPCFKVHELQIPCLKVKDHTETVLRNIMALEQYHYPRDTRICSYIDLMDCLINTEKDVDLLVGEGIISHILGDNASITNMFNQLCLQIGMHGSCYYKVSEELKAHFNNPLNHTKATLKRVYFSNPWKGTATIAAVILLLLTVIQTICSIMQVV